MGAADVGAPFGGDEARVTHYFGELGSAIHDAWMRANFAERALPEIAAAALAERPPHASVSPEDIIAWALRSRSLDSQQQGASFGQPPVNVYMSRRFYIEALFWLDGTTSIHQHAFDGAFCVLAGSSVHTTYDFEPSAHLSSGFRVGELRFRDSELLTQGAIRPIVSGTGFIHALFHLDRPSVSLVVRNFHTPTSGIQFNYQPPHVAVRPPSRAGPQTSVWAERLQAYLPSVMARSRPSWRAFVGEALRAMDPEEAWEFLLAASRMPELESEDEALLDLAAERFGALLPQVRASYDETKRTDELVEMRKLISDADHRFFLALLLNVPNTPKLLSLVRARHPSADPISTVMTWLAQLTTAEGQLGYEIGADALRLVELTLRKQPIDEIVKQVTGQDRPDDANVKQVLGALEQLKAVAVLRPLFRGSE